MAIGVSMPNFFCEVVEHEGKVVGILGGAIDKTVWGSLVATDIIFISRRNTDVLLKHFLKWADDMCAEMVQITNLADNKRYERLLAGLDFKQAGQVFIKEV